MRGSEAEPEAIHSSPVDILDRCGGSGAVNPVEAEVRRCGIQIVAPCWHGSKTRGTVRMYPSLPTYAPPRQR